VGESASTGVHGANRLASNSLLECLVFGAQLAQITLPKGAIAKPPALTQNLPPLELSLTPQIEEWRQLLPRLMWQSAGICRDQPSLEQAIAQVETWQAEFAAISQSAIAYIDQPTERSFSLTSSQATDLRTWSETRNLLDLSYLILKSALFRTESRGGHYRTDYPDTDNINWQVHTLVKGDTWKQSKV